MALNEDGNMIMNFGWVRIWKEVSMAYYKAPFQKLPEKNKENYCKP
jgi:hypothetical protein